MLEAQHDVLNQSRHFLSKNALGKQTLQAAAPVAGAIVVCDQGRHASTSAGLGALGLAAGIVALGVPAAVADSQTQERYVA